MSTIVPRIALSAAVLGVLVACSSASPENAGLDPRLEQDLSLAAATAVELAPSQGEQVTSALELVPQSAPQPTAPAPRQVRRSPSPTPQPERIVTPRPAPAPAPAPEPVMVAEMPAEEPLPIDGPGASPRPEAPDVIPVSGGPQRGDGMGGWGVVIRGGIGGVDDCRLHDMGRPGRRTGGVVISINDRIPGVRGTFPNQAAAGSPRIEISRPVSRGSVVRPRGFR
ncbi:MAG TPA: hypothetical protein VKZ41_10100 [Gemmatimonadales bacterium]|nr:hypothetical protein [Gemmatimonadales bacterium]